MHPIVRLVSATGYDPQLTALRKLGTIWAGASRTCSGAGREDVVPQNAHTARLISRR